MTFLLTLAAGCAVALLELAAFAEIVLRETPRTGSALVLHAGAALLFGAAVWMAHGRRHGLCWWRELLLHCSLALFIPLLGAVGSVATLVLGPRLREPGAGPRVESVATPDLPYMPEDTSLQPRFSIGGLRRALSEGDPRVRLQAVHAAGTLPGRLASPLLRLAMRDAEDEVRLGAYAYLDRLDSGIGARIHELEKRLGSADRDQRAAIHRQLAEQYWELCYLGLAEETMERHLLALAMEQLDASAAARRDPSLLILRGRVLLRLGLVREARTSLEQALAQGLPTASVASYLAEAAFLEADYPAVRRFVAAIPGDSRSLPLRQIRSFWA